ncbi:MAG: hypothetical protein A3D52_02580 [Candidatus Taylorbacteria bacterium RIFCSPHIGHO2_02_FULL_44_36]|uniref:Probable chemoreceptor glutamine deamidase CheD n=1 Tax=Candidatus Taylorbacteria bacterium RIFCSPLOWO2_12_FULL_44_15c TaxID=1802333 RepID=A0A1G2P777_9BACT|nr:MAG: hypothetical protein A3D52_02580 [Candidatus Taylorbacteria bacterium RIFCSPHIGHO2_02_FULL_44_36]OHA38037.1 MAG: hypothetical protein A3I97_03015 [Candidatus Taylorbacteria bacterium RIFCSPLOWO2_02_FULL_44_35]OHA43421.1 MAG: hypothetical protein A3G03_01235 [Candidatus Taylorbacteria bacterium RIFCSPLOWO2_12_FULL_44_15c]
MNTLTETKENRTIEVATGEVKAINTPAFLQCLTLGSCVAVILYDEERKIGGIAHVMLPSSPSINAEDADALKYANHAIHELIKQMLELGARGVALTARLVGGAQVMPNTPDIGKENIVAIRNTLQELGIKITDEQLGGVVGRSVLFDVTTGMLLINGKSSPIETTAPSSKEEKKESESDSSEYIKRLEENVAEQTKSLTVRVEELNNMRKAAFNLLEDLERERDRIAEAQAKNEAMLVSIGDGVVFSGQDMRVGFINQAAEVATGWSSQEVLGKIWSEVIALATENGKLVPPTEGPLFLALHKRKTTITDATNTTATYFYTRKDKTKFPVAFTVSPVKIGSQTIGAISVFRDITREKEIDKTKSEFVSLASHQLRTPLTTISWYTEMILKGDVGTVIPKQKKYLDEIYQGNQRMIELVNTLLDVSRLELGTFKMEPKPTDVVALAGSVLNEQKPKIEKKKLVLIENFSKDIPPFLTDPKLLRMVFQNLLANAVEYTPQGGKIEVVISFDKKNIQIKVSDTGYGIPKNQQGKIFTKFFRADNVREKDTDGTGLGLYIVKSIVENSGGKIWFESPASAVGRTESASGETKSAEGYGVAKENPGTTFFVTLPLGGMKKEERRYQAAH